MTTPVTPQPMTQRAKILFFVGTILALAAMWAMGSNMNSGRSCEDLWDENRSTAEGPYMDKERYVANCEETNRQIRNGDFPGS